jgi:2,4-dienoyl-CoA reductase (NADPH2)
VRLLAMRNMIICAEEDSMDEVMPVAETVGGPQFHKIGGAKLDAKRAIREGAVLEAGLSHTRGGGDPWRHRLNHFSKH